jgi:hypothetical protein
MVILTIFLTMALGVYKTLLTTKPSLLAVVKVPPHVKDETTEAVLDGLLAVAAILWPLWLPIFLMTREDRRA